MHRSGSPVLAALLSLAARPESHEEKEREERQHGQATAEDDDSALRARRAARPSRAGRPVSPRRAVAHRARVRRRRGEAAAQAGRARPGRAGTQGGRDAAAPRHPRIAAEKQRAATLLAAEAEKRRERRFCRKAPFLRGSAGAGREPEAWRSRAREIRGAHRRRQGVRLLPRRGRAARRRGALLEPRRAQDEGGRKGAARLPLGAGLRRPGPATCRSSGRRRRGLRD